MHLSPIVVLKFGSSVLSSVDAMPRVVREISRHIEQGQRVVAIVSAFAGETDKLLETLHQVDVKADSYRIADFVSTGERQSSLLLSIALERLGLITKLLGPADIGLRAEGLVLDADPDQLDVSALATTGGTLVGAGPSRYADVTASTGEDCDQDR